jgi:hypothetical protein
MPTIVTDQAIQWPARSHVQEGKENKMLLLSGADVSIRFDLKNKVYIATAGIGLHSMQAITKDPVQALGLAVMLQAGFTKKNLKAELADRAHRQLNADWLP